MVWRNGWSGFEGDHGICDRLIWIEHYPVRVANDPGVAFAEKVDGAGIGPAPTPPVKVEIYGDRGGAMLAKKFVEAIVVPMVAKRFEFVRYSIAVGQRWRIWQCRDRASVGAAR